MAAKFSGIDRVLVLKVRALGDTLLATPALAALRRGLPGARITAVVSPAGAEVLAGNPDVDEVRVYHKESKAWSYHLEFARALARERYDLAIALHASFRTALLARLSGAPKRVVHNHSGRNFFTTLPIPAKKEAKSTIQRDLDAVRALGLAPAGEHLKLVLKASHRAVARAFLRKHHLNPGRFMVLVPGAGKDRKRWTAQAAAAFLDAARRLKISWVILAGPADLPLAQAIQAQAQGQPPIFAQGVKEAAALLAASRGVVTTDSGPKHLAVAVGAPTLTLWTDEPEAEWHPYDLKRHALVRSPSGLVADISADAVLAVAVRHFKLRKA
jgi:ADP-heptose:LPS heptosyltransferase